MSIQTRAGYFAPADPAEETVAKKNEKPAKKMAQGVSDAKINQYRAALTSLVLLPGIPLELTTHFIHTPPAGSRAFITARIDATNLGNLGGKASYPVLEVVGVVLDESGKTVNNFSHNFELKSGTDALAQRQSRELNYHNVVPLSPGVYYIRLKQIGSASDWVEIPDLTQKALTLSSIFLTEEGRDLEDVYNAPSGYVARERQSRESRRGSGQTVYSSPPGEMTWNAEQNEQGVPCVARLPLVAYEPGNYELQVEITDLTTMLAAVRRIGFLIE